MGIEPTSRAWETVVKILETLNGRHLADLSSTQLENEWKMRSAVE